MLKINHLKRFAFMNDIKSFKPFHAYFKSYCGSYYVSVRFTCPNCGSHDVKSRKDLNFFQNHFYCGSCGYSKDDLDGYPFYYASSCFRKTYEPIVEQLSLF